MSTSSRKNLSAALVGTGRIGWMLESDHLRGGACTHAGALNKTGRVEIVAAADPDRDRLEAFGRTWDVDRLYENHEQLLENSAVDILSIASPTASHCRIVCDAAASGKVRAIYCEKPISRTLDEADQMIEACEKAGVNLTIGHERRFGAHFIRARELVRNGDIGEVRTLIGQALTGDPGSASIDEAGGGPLLHDGTHLTDLMNFFCGRAEWVVGSVKRSHGSSMIEHTAYGMASYPYDIMAFIEGGGRRKYFTFELEIQGTNGVIGVGNSPPALWRAESSRRFSGFNELTEDLFPSYNPNNGFVAAFEGLIGEMEGGEKSLSTGRDGRAALEIILALYESSARGGQKINLRDFSPTPG